MEQKTTWNQKNNTLRKTFEFSNFKEVSEFAKKLFELYEELNHHPDTLLHNYKLITITSTTHDAQNTLTELDFKLSRRVDEIFNK